MAGNRAAAFPAGRQSPAAAVFRILLATCAWRLCGGAVCSTGFSWYADLANGDAGVVRSLEYIPDPYELVVAGGEDQLLRVWPLSPFSSVPYVFSGHQEAIWALEWISDYSVLASGSGDGMIRFWPIAQLLGDPTSANDGSPLGSARDGSCSLYHSNDGSCLGSEGQHVVSWHDAGMAVRHQVHSLVWASSVGQLVSGWSDTRIRTWVYDSSVVAPDTPWKYTGYIQSQDRVYDMVWLPTYNLLGTASPDQRHPRLWTGLSNETATLPEHATYTYLSEGLGINTSSSGEGGFGDCPWAHCDAVLGLAANAASDKMVSGSMDNSVILWSIATKNRLCQMIGHTDYVTSVTWLHTEAKIASGSKDNTILIWDPEDCLYSNATQDTPLETLTSHTGAINALEWFSNESYGNIISGGADGSVKLWTCS